MQETSAPAHSINKFRSIDFEDSGVLPDDPSIKTVQLLRTHSGQHQHYAAVASEKVLGTSTMQRLPYLFLLPPKLSQNHQGNRWYARGTPPNKRGKSPSKAVVTMVAPEASDHPKQDPND